MAKDSWKSAHRYSAYVQQANAATIMWGSKFRSAVAKRLRWTTRYIREVVKWLFQVHPGIVSSGLLMLLALVYFGHSCMEPRIRLSGMCLQLLGVTIVAIGLSDTRRAFNDQPSIWGIIKQWWEGRPRFGPRNVIITAAGISIGVSSGTARGRVSPGPNARLDQRIELLERQYASLFDEVGKLSEETKTRADELSGAVQGERQEREQGDKDIKSQILKAVAEGIPLQLFGAVLFLVGIIAGTASPELESICKAL